MNDNSWNDLSLFFFTKKLLVDIFKINLYSQSASQVLLYILPIKITWNLIIIVFQNL